MIALMNAVCLSLLLPLLSMPRTQAVTCYSCILGVDAGCGDHLRDAEVKTVEGDYCSKIAAGSPDGTTGPILIKDAESGTPVSLGCNSATISGVEAHLCYCSTDLCNAGTTFHSGRDIAVVSVVMYLVRILVQYLFLQQHRLVDGLIDGS